MNLKRSFPLILTSHTHPLALPVRRADWSGRPEFLPKGQRPSHSRAGWWQVLAKQRPTSGPGANSSQCHITCAEHTPLPSTLEKTRLCRCCLSGCATPLYFGTYWMGLVAPADCPIATVSSVLLSIAAVALLLTIHSCCLLPTGCFAPIVYPFHSPLSRWLATNHQLGSPRMPADSFC